jgi:Putative MetA-pathway of phenol degradation
MNADLRRQEKPKICVEQRKSAATSCRVFLCLHVCVAAFLLFLSSLLCAQTLAPRAYVITPVESNAVTITSSLYQGDVLFDNSLPITDDSGTISITIPTYYRALNFFGRSANITVGVPYAVASMQALVVDQRQNTYRSGLGDGAVRFSVNLMGGPAMKLPQFIKWKQKRLLGASLIVQAPTGQYDPHLLINIGNNRWAFKPELGYSERHGNWLFDVYVATLLFTKTPEFFSRNSFVPGTQERTQQPIEVVEGHLSYDFKPRLWVSLDANFWYGGRISLNGVENRATLQRNSRVGATAAIPITTHQTVKFSYDRGALVHVGGKYDSVQVAWQYGWIGGFWPK